ncbi:MAG: magnesium transporter [Myxococcales bacterium]|nr:magnesium transporter [Myxococcales bacterium]
MTPSARLAGALARSHAAEAARFLETAEQQEGADWLSELPAADAAGVIARAVPVAAARALGGMEPLAAAAVVESLEPRAAAALIRRLPQDVSAAIVAALPTRAANRIDQLTAYGPDQAGSHLDPRAPAVKPEATVEQALELVRRAAEGALNYVYVVREEQRLCGVLSMRELMLADPSVTVDSVMVPNPYSVQASDPIAAVVRHPGWRRAHAMPVLDEDGHFLGVIRHSRFRALESELGEARQAAAPQDTSAALAELFWLGSASLMRLGEAALFGRQSHERGDER